MLTVSRTIQASHRALAITGKYYGSVVAFTKASHRLQEPTLIVHTEPMQIKRDIHSVIDSVAALHKEIRQSHTDNSGVAVAALNNRS